MKQRIFPVLFFCAMTAFAAVAAIARPAQPRQPLPINPLPVQVNLAGATVLVYSLQVNSWDDNVRQQRLCNTVRNQEIKR